jgi:hypothetical protein
MNDGRATPDRIRAALLTGAITTTGVVVLASLWFVWLAFAQVLTVLIMRALLRTRP